MFSNEQSRVEDFLRNKGAGSRSGQKLVFDGRTGKIRVVGRNDPDSQYANISGEQLGFAGGR
jgi:hypothetical protein